MKFLRLSLCGREKVIENFHALYAERRHVLMVGPPGIGKTALLQRLSETCPMLLCEETTGLRRICDSLERHLRRERDKLNVIERKNQLLACLERRGELVAFDQVGVTPPRWHNSSEIWQSAFPYGLRVARIAANTSVMCGSISTNLHALKYLHS